MVNQKSLGKWKNFMGGLAACFFALAIVLAESTPAFSATVKAIVCMTPRTIDLSGNGKYVSVYVELPRPYKGADIAINTVTMTVNGNNINALSKAADAGSLIRGSSKGLIVKFDRQELQSHLFMGTQVVTISGSISGGDIFNGTDKVQVILDKKYQSRLTILQTSDLHNHASGYGPYLDYTPNNLYDDKVTGGFARLATLIGNVRQRQTVERIPTLLVDSGDFSMGTTYDLTAANPITLKFFQSMGYDAVTFGNHEFDWGPGGAYLLLQNGKSNGFAVPVIATNTVTDGEANTDDDGIEALKLAGAIVSKKILTLSNGLKVGLLGLMGPNADAEAPVAGPAAFNHDWAFIQKCVDELRKQDKVDIVAILSHGGVENDGTGDDADLAKNVLGIDIIASGHYHTATDHAIIAGSSDSLIFSPGEYGQYLSRLNIIYSKSLHRVVGYDFNLLPVDDSVPGAPAVQAMVNAYNAQIDNSLTAAGLPALETVVSATKVNLELEDYQTSPLGSICADAIRNVSNALAPLNYPTSPIDISVVPSGVIRDPILVGNKGRIAFSDVYNSMPLGISPYQTSPPGYPLMHLYLTGAEVYLMAEIGLTFSQEIGSDYYLNFSGIKIDYDPAKAVWLNGVQKVYLYSYNDPFCTGTPALIDPSDTTRLYHIAVDLYTLEMLNVVNGYLPSGYSITPKDADGGPLTSQDFIDYRIDATPSDGVVELKAWMALLNYIKGLGGTIPAGIYGPGGAFEDRVNYIDN